MALVLGIGSGLFSLVVIWVLGLVLCIALARASGPISVGIFGVGLVLIAITVGMIMYPRKSLAEEAKDAATSNTVDNLSIPRIILFSFICVFFVIGLLLYFVDSMEPLYTPSVSSRRQYSF